ncbi:alpha/beta-tubulin-N-acetyltransferase 9-like [Eriocheir sinensis]|uniref:alpha/beta-tubulin-N-acetyltransferase 9-like n=1 Tax=Eriocheir sinensis TaxID=95602 RepID=UPI0021C84544|nr:alpha/beta-tubulin-N-acetyltransferase 9-like [Eriocheir sinensis]XP_050693988.1 alpha/beta-tubulin-N-acetyltransferase 9-like [Eriocheir sinensis]
MRTNSKTRVVGQRVELVPYRSVHVERYHQWMSSDELRSLTASLSLTLEEEHRMQEAWMSDDDKCTFIILDRALLASRGSETEAMIGDTNLFLTDPEDRNLAEAEIMIAEPAFRGERRGWEAMLLMLRYGLEYLGVTRYQAKIGEGNTPSINMFTKMHFCEVGRSEVFQEVTLEVVVDESWRNWLRDNTPVFQCLPYTPPDE